MASTMSYVSKSAQFEYHYQTVPERLALQAKLRPEKEVYVFLHPDGRRDSVTAGRLYELSTSMARGLTNLGIKKGDVVAIAAANDLDGLVSLLGVICAGGIALSAIVKDEDGTNVRELLRQTEATCLILTPGQERKEFNACMNFIDDVQQNGQAKSAAVPTLNYFLSTEQVQDKDILAIGDLIKQDHSGIGLPRLDPEDTMVFFCTSGSTGEPKIVPRSHHSAMITGFHLQESMQYDADDDVIYSERRFAWIGGFPYMFLHDGVKVVTKTAPFVSFTEHCKFTYSAIVNERCTVACLFPVTITGLLDVANDSPKYLLKTIQTGALPVTQTCMSAIGKITAEVVNMYGSSEAGFCSSDHVTDKNTFTDYSTGFPHQGVEIKVVGPDGFVLKRGEIGRIYVRSPCLLREYFKDEQGTKQVLTKNHWMDTDDTGYIDETGRLIVSGRCSDTMLQGGRPFTPSTTEAFIKQHPGVTDVIVVAVPDAVLFERVTACVIPKAGSGLTSEDISSYFKRRHLSSAGEAFSVTFPELVLIFDDFPRLYTGKPDKKKLKQEAVKRANEMKI